MRLTNVRLHLFRWILLLLFPVWVKAAPVEFDLPSQSAASSLLAFSSQAKIEVLFSFDELRNIQSVAVVGRYEPESALIHLLGNSGLVVKRNANGKFVVASAKPVTGTVKGHVRSATGEVPEGLRVTLLESRQSTRLDAQGNFQIERVPPGTYRVTLTGNRYQRLQVDQVKVEAGVVTELENTAVQKVDDLTRLDPYVVQGQAEPPRPFARSRDALPPRDAVGNLDIPRTENDALPYAIFDREQIIRSGVVGLNEFLKRSVLESDVTQVPENVKESISAGSNLKLRGFNDDETVILINGRRLPEILTNGESRHLGSDVNFIPLSLIQQVEVLPTSASALYSGNAVGGVINIVLRPNVEATEVTATYTNAVDNYDAPQSSVSLLHGQTLLGGKLRLRVNASFTESMPPAESELGYLQRLPKTLVPLDQPLYRATPNVRSEDGSALPGGNSPVTSVALGATGNEGLAAFANRNGVRNFDLFDSGSGLATSLYSRNYAYGREQHRSAYFGSAVYDFFPWLQTGVDATYVRTTVNRGTDVFNADLVLKSTSPFNPFGKDVKVSLNDTAPLLGKNYSEADLELYSVVFGMLVKLPADWQVAFDAQYARNISKYRGLAQPDKDHWQQLVDDGAYNPLRDTQTSAPPAAFYDRALVYYGGKGKFVTLGDFDSIDAAVRVTNRKLVLPTGNAVVNFGGDYRRSHLNPFLQEYRFGDGSLAEEPVHWTGRTLQRYSGFGELQASLLPAKWLPRWLRKLETDVAVRYIAADSAAESNVAPTVAFRAEFPGGFSVRGSVTTSSRFPTPQMSLPQNSGGSTGGIGSDTIVRIFDPRRDNDRYDVITREVVNTGLSTEDSVTQSAGAVWQRGKIHRFRLAVDFVDTRKVNELVPITEAQNVMSLENVFPDRVTRAAASPGDPFGVGRVTTLYTGILNLSSRHSQNWSTSFDYMWAGIFGGTFESYARWLYFQRYDRRLVPEAPLTDELDHPDSTASGQGLLKQRFNFGSSWSNSSIGFGVDGHYFSAHTLPMEDWVNQGSTQIKPYWQFDAFVQSDLGKWIPWKHSRYGLRGQLRVNNISGFDYPKYVNNDSGVQPYGDWRGRTYSISVTATF